MALNLKDKLLGAWKVLTTTQSEDKPNPLVSHYDVLESLYLNSGVYDRLSDLALEGTETRTNLAALRSLRNPANLVVEFYAAKVHTDIEAVEYGEEAELQSDNLTSAIRSVERWSNWDAEGRVAVRQMAWAGDLFVKIAHRERDGVPVSVYRERIDPRHVTDLEADERGYATYLRVETPKTRLESGTTREERKEESYTLTEIWDKETALYSAYEHTTAALGDPVQQTVLSAAPVPEEEGGYTGYDFIPVVHFKFRDVGGERGLSAFGHAVGGIKEADRIATVLHEMLFPDEVWTLQRAPGPDGVTLPPLELEDDAVSPSSPYLAATSRLSRNGQLAENYATVGKKRIARLPSGASLEPKIPNRNLGELANVLDKQVSEVERQLPETAYSRLRELELSGRAIRYSMMDVIDRFTEAFANYSQGVVRLNQMALTMGQVLKIPGFAVDEIGEYGTEGAAFEHTFKSPDPFPASRMDEAEAESADAVALTAYKEIGGEPYRRYLVERGYTEEEADTEVAGAANAPVNPLAGLLGGTGVGL